MEQNHFNWTRVSHFLWGLNLFFIKRPYLSGCLIAALFCLFWWSLFMDSFVLMFPVRQESQSERNNEKWKKANKRRREGGRDWRWKDSAEEWLSPSAHASWLSICLTDWFWFNRGLTGTLEFDGQVVGAISWFRPQAKLFWVGVSYLYSGEIEHSR